RRLPFRPTLVDGLALAYGLVVVLYAVLPQGALAGEAGTKAVLYGLRHALVPVAAFFLGRSLAFGAREWRALVWTILLAAGLVAAGLPFTFSRSPIVARAGGLVVLAVLRRRAWPLGAAALALAAGLGFAAVYPSVAPRTHWFAADLPYQIAGAKQRGPLP